MKPDTSNPVAFIPPGSPPTAPETNRNGSQLGNQEPGADTEDRGYDSVPPKQTVTVSVRYRIRGRGQPLRYPLYEE